MRSEPLARGGARPGGLGTALRLKIELWLAVVFMTLAFGAGVLVRGISEPPREPAVGVAPAGMVPAAPPLTEDQLQQGLPQGHPDIGAPDQGKGGGSKGNEKPSPGASP